MGSAYRLNSLHHDFKNVYSGKPKRVRGRQEIHLKFTDMFWFGPWGNLICFDDD